MPTFQEVAEKYRLSGEIGYVKLGKGTHLIKVGDHRTLCGRVLSRLPSPDGKTCGPFPQPSAEGSLACTVCSRIANAAINKHLAETVGQTESEIYRTKGGG